MVKGAGTPYSRLYVVTRVGLAHSGSQKQRRLSYRFQMEASYISLLSSHIYCDRK